MIRIRPSIQRGSTNIGWLDSKHSFSFGRYYDEENMGFRNLRVINEDRVMPSRGFGTHGHRDMEIISYVISGALAHEDSMGNGSIIREGDVQRMSAGTGVQHSEFNASDSDMVHFLQIWILPNEPNHVPGYEEQNFSGEKNNTLRLLISGSKQSNALHINADVRIFGSQLENGQTLTYTAESDRHIWIQMIHGELEVQSGAQRIAIQNGDGLGISHRASIQLAAKKECDFLLFDLP